MSSAFKTFTFFFRNVGLKAPEGRNVKAKYMALLTYIVGPDGNIADLQENKSSCTPGVYFCMVQRN